MNDKIFYFLNSGTKTFLPPSKIAILKFIFGMSEHMTLQRISPESSIRTNWTSKQFFTKMNAHVPSDITFKTERFTTYPTNMSTTGGKCALSWNIMLVHILKWCRSGGIKVGIWTSSRIVRNLRKKIPLADCLEFSSLF